MRSKFRSFAGTAAAAAFALATVPGSVAAEQAGHSTDGFVSVAGPNGGTAGWASNEYLKDHPNAIPGVTVKPKPESAFGCNRDVCIDVDGESTTVVDWKTQAFGNTGCANAYFAWKTDYYVGPTVCPNGGGPGVYYDNTGPTGYFPVGDKLCNYWRKGPAGDPCINIEL